MSKYEPFPDIEIIIADRSLPLADVEDFAAEYSVTTAASVITKSQWGGPAAGGIGWGGPEIAVIIVVGELLRRSTSEAFDMAKAFVLHVYSRIKTRNAARWYVDGAMALAIDDESGSTRLLFCFPEGLDKDALEERIRLVEAHQESLLNEWAKEGHSEVRLCWREEPTTWVECQPAPEDEESYL